MTMETSDLDVMKTMNSDEMIHDVEALKTDHSPKWTDIARDAKRVAETPRTRFKVGG